MSEGELLRDQIARAIARSMLWGHEHFADWKVDDVRDFTFAAADSVLDAFDVRLREPQTEETPHDLCKCGHERSYHRPYCHGNPSTHCREFVSAGE